MTLNAGTTRIRYTASGGTDFTFDFPIWLKTDIKVYVDEGEKTVDTDYTVTFTAGSESGGTVGFLSAPNSGLNVEIVRRLDVERDSDFATSGAFSMTTLNEQLDKLTAFVQDSRDRIDRTVEIPAATSGGVSPALGAPAALSMIRWNSGATAWEYITTDDIDTTVQASAWVIDTFTDGVDWTSGVTTDFTLTTTPGPEKNTQIYLDGVYQAKGLYVLVGDTVTFAAAPTGTTLESMVITAAESQSLTSAESIQFNTSPTGITPIEGLMYWNDTAKTLDIGLATGVIMQVGQEMPLWVKNESGAAVDDGDMVYVSGSTGVHLVVGLADASDLSKCSQIGMVTTAAGIANNDFGFVTRFGAVRDIDTSAFSEGDIVYLSAATPGALTGTVPGDPDYTVPVGIVVRDHATEGVIGIDPKTPISAAVALSTSDLVAPTQGAVKTYADAAAAAVKSTTVYHADQPSVSPETTTTGDTDLLSFTLTGGDLATGDILDIEGDFFFDYTGGGTATVWLHVGASATIVAYKTAIDAADNKMNVKAQIFNKVAASDQRIHFQSIIVDDVAAAAQSTVNVAKVDIKNTGVDTTADVLIKFSAQCGDGTDKIVNYNMFATLKQQ